MKTEQAPPIKEIPVIEEEIQTDEKNVWAKIGIIVGVVIILALLIGSIIFLLTTQPSTTAKVRDVFIIFMALEFLVIGMALIILIVQVAKLINLLQNEVKPILASTNETANMLRGTTQFLSDHVVEPVIKLNEYLASLKSLRKIFRS